MPGLDLDDLEISVQGETVTLRGKRRLPELGEGDVWRRHERGHGEFVRTVAMPFKVDSDRTEAGYTNGILKVSLPKLPEEQVKKVTIEAG